MSATIGTWIDRLVEAGPHVSPVRNNARRKGLYRADVRGVVIIERRAEKPRADRRVIW